MRGRPPQIVAFGGGGFSTTGCSTPLEEHLLALTREQRPRVCFLPTASGDADHYVVRFYRAFPASRCEPSHISLFRRQSGVGDPRAHLLEQDLVYVGGGSLVSLLGTWRAHGIDVALREAWQAGVIMCGGSAGSLCWFSQSLSAFHDGGPKWIDALGLLPWSNSVHYDEEPGRGEAFRAAVADGMVPGYGVSDGAALHFVGTELEEVVAVRDCARAVHVQAGEGGEVNERQLPVRLLGSSSRGTSNTPVANTSGAGVQDPGAVAA
jgi:dipeptidase E